MEEPDELDVTLSTIMGKVINEEDYGKREGVIVHEEGVSFLPCNIELSGLEVTLVNTMRREYILKEYITSRDFIVFDNHIPELTKELIEKSSQEDLFPAALFVSEIREHGTTIRRYDVCDDFNANAFGENIRDRNEEQGIRTMTTVATRKQPEKVHEVSKAQQDVVEAFRAKTREMFHELDGCNAESIESMVRSHVEDALHTFSIDAQVVDVVLVGSRCRGLEHEDSDVDVFLVSSFSRFSSFSCSLAISPTISLDGCSIL